MAVGTGIRNFFGSLLTSKDKGPRNAPTIAQATIVVSDAGPLHYLILIGQTELLPRLYGQVVVPVTVVSELQHPRTPVTVRAWIGALPTWLDIRKTDVDPTGTPLGVAELPAITLVGQLHADLVSWTISMDALKRNDAF